MTFSLPHIHSFQVAAAGLSMGKAGVEASLEIGRTGLCQKRKFAEIRLKRRFSLKADIDKYQQNTALEYSETFGHSQYVNNPSAIHAYSELLVICYNQYGKRSDVKYMMQHCLASLPTFSTLPLHCTCRQVVDVDDFINGIKRAFELLGYRVYEVSLKDKSSDDELLSQLSLIDTAQLKLALSVNALAVELINKLPQLATIPFYTYLVDHPIHLLPRFYGTKAKLLCVDKEHVTFLSQLGIQAQFWPHAVCDTELSAEYVPFSQKKGILFPASFTDESAHFAEINKVAPNIAAKLTDANVRSISDVLRMLGFMQSGISPSVQLNDQIVTFLRRCDLYLRGRDRNTLIKECHQAGLALTIVGSNWDKTHQYDSHYYLPAVPFTELKNLISNSRFVLHHSPGFEQGQHERVVYPLARGTSVLSSATRYLFESYGSDNGVAFYNSMAELKQISVSVSEGHYSSWINNANSIIERNETWRSRIAML